MNIFRLSIKALVRSAIEVRPKYVRIKGSSGEEIRRSIDIIAMKDRPLKIDVVKFDLSDSLGWQIKEVKKGRRYRIDITGKLDRPGRLRGVMRLKTNYPEKPVINIWISVNAYTKAPKPY